MSTALVWFRQDLRCQDNPALATACQNHDQIIPLYIYDELQDSLLGAAQCWWLHHSLLSLEAHLKQFKLQLCLQRGQAISVLESLIERHQIDAVYWNRCYEPSRMARDKSIKASLKQRGLVVESSNASLLNEPWQIKNKAGDYFKVFTPFWRAAEAQVQFDLVNLADKGLSSPQVGSDRLEDWHLLPQNPNWASEFPSYWQPGEAGAEQRLRHFIDQHLHDYDKGRDLPGAEATSGLSPHLHFGEISPRQIWQAIKQTELDPRYSYPSIKRFLTELGWREFSYYLLYHFPALPEKNYKSEFDHFPWHQDEAALKAWQQGKTGYPIVDAGMRELWRTGYMHNRVRMIVASFLTKHLLLDWRAGADWFWQTLLDADLASNSASWQWVAGSGADAAPYFRIFNPVLQGEKFDPEGHYIKKWLPELASLPKAYLHQPWLAPARLRANYPDPIVDHSMARTRALAAYQQCRS